MYLQIQIINFEIKQIHLKYQAYNTFNKIECDQLIAFKDAVQISQILKDQGVLIYEGEINELILTYLQASGLYNQGQGKFIKQVLQIKKMNVPLQEFNNCYGKYDYIEQKFQNQINCFKQVDINSKQEIIDENELLNDGVQVKQVESCASKPRACANCTCGRKEMEEKQDQEQLLEQLKNNSVKGCGSCYLGDAFRCANCPFRGLPAFKDGEQVKVLYCLIIINKNIKNHLQLIQQEYKKKENMNNKMMYFCKNKKKKIKLNWKMEKSNQRYDIFILTINNYTFFNFVNIFSIFIIYLINQFFEWKSQKEDYLKLLSQLYDHQEELYK